MQVDIIWQKDKENTLAKKIAESFERKPKRAYFFIGNLKENGYRILEEEIVDTKTAVHIILGIDKRNTTKLMLENLLKYATIYIHSNNDLVEFDSNICIFEYDKAVTMYSASSNFSESGVLDNTSIYTQIIYDLSNSHDKEAYKKQLKEILKNTQEDKFEKLTKTKLNSLISEKEIFSTSHYTHTVKSISELLGKTAVKQVSEEESDDIYIHDIAMPKVDLSDISLDIDDIDFSQVEDSFNVQKISEVQDFDMEEVKKISVEQAAVVEDEIEEIEAFEDVENIAEEIRNSHEFDDVEFDESDTLDINSLLFSKADIKLDIGDIKELNKKREEKETSEQPAEDELVKVKKINLNNVTNFIFELPQKIVKGKEVNAIKIPNYIHNMIPEFFSLGRDVKNIEIDGVKYKSRDISLEIVDVKNSQKIFDKDAKLMQKSGQTYITFRSDVLTNMQYNENDILRIIKLSDNIYHMEIVDSNIQEYKLWHKLCVNKFKSTERKYGMM